MCYSASSFNQDISKWNLVTNMRGMFLYASAFNQELCWCLKEGVDRNSMFYGSGGSIGCPSD
jgi:hypothetical protein